MPYPEQWVTPMRQELTRIGVEELRTAEDVDQAITGEQGTVLVVVNSICGCAAARARPAIADALGSDPKPDRLTTVFAGQDLEATARAREYFFPYPPSSSQHRVAERRQAGLHDGAAPDREPGSLRNLPGSAGGLWPALRQGGNRDFLKSSPALFGFFVFVLDGVQDSRVL